MKNYNEWSQMAAALSLKTQAYIDGGYRPAADGATLDTINPATEQVIAAVASCGDIDVELAVSAARRSFTSGCWSQRTPADRKRVLLCFADLVEHHSEELALLDTLDMGKPIADSLGFDLPSTVETIRWSAESIDKVYGEIAPTGDEALALIQREPIGVVAAIVPWNYPLMMASWKFAPALAAGNSVILKPSEKSPLSALRLAELATEAGVPDGVFNVLPGYGHTVGKALALHLDVDVLAFTGSTAVAGQLMQYAGQSNLKRVWLEAGGKSPCIIFADCKDLEAAAATSAYAIFSNQGEVCIATSRLYVEESIREPFMKLLLQEAAKFVPGDPLDPATNMGPLVDRQQLDRVCAYVASGAEEGARLLVGGEPTSVQGKGYYLSPTIFDQTHETMKVVREEIFGPVLAVDSFSCWQEAIDKANNSDFGLGASVWTSSLNKAHRSSRALEAGMVWVNGWAGGNSSTPFGGVKQSGNGRDKSLHALDKFSELKMTWIALDGLD
tara:strand:- start:6518 stop:8017 length:1500 start_codon:yes stop_codon:yes gene_type:complete